MASALAGGLVRTGAVPSEHVIASDPFPKAREAFEKDTGGRTTEVNHEVVKASNVIILAIALIIFNRLVQMTDPVFASHRIQLYPLGSTMNLV